MMHVVQPAWNFNKKSTIFYALNTHTVFVESERSSGSSSFRVMSIRSQAARRRNSYVEIASNPLENSGSDEEPKEHKMEILANCTHVSQAEMATIKDALNSER
jgi:hypothetical protein